MLWQTFFFYFYFHYLYFCFYLFISTLLLLLLVYHREREKCKPCLGLFMKTDQLRRRNAEPEVCEGTGKEAKGKS